MSDADTSAGGRPGGDDFGPGGDTGLVAPEGTNQDSGRSAGEVPAGGLAPNDEAGLLGASPGASFHPDGEPEEPESLADVVPDTPPGPGQQYAAGEG